RALAFAPAGRVRADLLEAYAFECYLVDQLDDAVRSIREAATLRAEDGDGLRHGGDLRHLSRYLWCVGDNQGARREAERAVAVLERHPAGRELAMAYEIQARLHMLAEERTEALRWARKTARLAPR